MKFFFKITPIFILTAFSTFLTHAQNFDSGNLLQLFENSVIQDDLILDSKENTINNTENSVCFSDNTSKITTNIELSYSKRAGKKLKQNGVKAVYTPKNYQLKDIMSDIVGIVEGNINQ